MWPEGPGEGLVGRQEKELSVSVTGEVFAQLQKEAGRRGVSIETVAVELLHEQLRGRTQPKPGKGVVRPFRCRP